MAVERCTDTTNNSCATIRTNTSLVLSDRRTGPTQLAAESLSVAPVSPTPALSSCCTHALAASAIPPLFNAQQCLHFSDNSPALALLHNSAYAPSELIDGDVDGKSLISDRLFDATH